MRSLSVTPAILIAATTLVFSASLKGKAGLNQAAALYQQGKYDSSLARLEVLKSDGSWKRRDSLSLFQYLGMASARTGRDSASIGYFSELLRIDSLFQFPNNEDALVLKDFASAKEARTSSVNPAARTEAASTPDPVGAPIKTSVRLETEPRKVPERPLTGLDPLHSEEPAPGFVQDQNPARSLRGHGIGLAYGALPLGVGWVERDRLKSGLILGILEAGGLILSVYASEIQSNGENDAYAVRDHRELTGLQQWQWVQRVSLSTALGAYLFSLIASAGD